MSDSPALHSRWLLLLKIEISSIVHCCFSISQNELKWTHSGTIPARFGLIWFCGFRGEDLNVIFYQNMPNLHNPYISAERKILQKNPEYENCFRQHRPPFKMAIVTKNRNFFNCPLLLWYKSK
jgi:hypothetical protein